MSRHRRYLLLFVAMSARSFTVEALSLDEIFDGVLSERRAVGKRDLRLNEAVAHLI